MPRVIYTYEGTEYFKSPRPEPGCKDCAFDVTPGSSPEVEAKQFAGCKIADCKPQTIDGQKVHFVFWEKLKPRPLPPPTPGSVVLVFNNRR